MGIDRKAARSAWSQAAVFVAVLLCITVIWVVRRTLLVFATSVMFAYLLCPFVDALERRFPRKSRALAVVVPFLVIFGLITTFGLFIKAPLRSEYDSVAAQVRQKGFEQEVRAWRPLDLPVGEHLVDMYHQNDFVGMIPEVSKVMGTGLRYLLNFFIIPILSFFILKDGRIIRKALLDMLGSKWQAERILLDAHVLLLQYMRSLLLLCLATLVVFTIALSLLGVPYPILLALIAFPLEFVPMAGPLASAAIIVGVSEFTHYPHVPWVIAFLLSFRLFQDYVLAPHLMKKGVELHPLLVLFGIFAGGEIGNVPGIFLSVPLLALLRLVYFEVSKRRRIPESRTMAVETLDAA